MTKILTNKNTLIASIEDWAEIYASGNKAKHWKPGRSAYSIAEYVMNRNGLDRIADRVGEVLDEVVEFEKVTPELELTFDEFGQGRVHDLGIYGRTSSGKSLFIGVEAKVDESFNKTTSDVYLQAVARRIGGGRTKAPERIENLLKIHFRKPEKEVFNLRYQLLYATAGTLAAKQDISLLYIIVFKTALYDDLKGLDNLKDYFAYINAVRSEELACSRPESRVHTIKVFRKSLYSIYEQVILKD